MKAIRILFNLVAYGLAFLAKKASISYHAMNIVVYYFLIPFSWAVMGDYILGLHYFKLLSATVLLWSWLQIKDFEAFSVRLFQRSVEFLLWFRRIGAGYQAASVWICVAVPLAIYALLIYACLVKHGLLQ